ncbi:MAG: MOSC domain-containing protein [Planctomycetota bacterium]|nr:MOSC domain-containing protein [Planctomycetota bacterium]
MQATIHQISLKPERAGARGLPKEPVPEAILTTSGLRGDFNRYRHEKKQDAPHMALLLLPVETIQALKDEGWPVEPGHLGENLTTRGISYTDFYAGRKFRIGQTEIEITEEAAPCSNLYGLPYIGREKGPSFLKSMLNRRGWYARVRKQGAIKVGDSIQPMATQKP